MSLEVSRVNFQDAVELFEREDPSALDGEHAAAKACSSPGRNDGDIMFVGVTQDGLNLFGRFWKGYGIRQEAQIFGPVVAISFAGGGAVIYAVGHAHFRRSSPALVLQRSVPWLGPLWGPPCKYAG